MVDDEVIRDLHQRSYDDEVRGTKRLHFLNLTRVAGVARTGNETRLTLGAMLDSEPQELDVDALVFATGYEGMDPARLLGDFDREFLRDETGRPRVERDYRLVSASGLSCGIYLQGGTEHTHGLSSSLLSNIAVRSGEIADSIVLRRAERELGGARTVEVAGATAGRA